MPHSTWCSGAHTSSSHKSSMEIAMQASELYLTRVTTVTRRRKHLPAYHQRVSCPHGTGGMATLGKGVKRWNLEPPDGDVAAGGAAYATTGTTTGAAVSGVAAGATAAKDKRY